MKGKFELPKAVNPEHFVAESIIEVISGYIFFLLTVNLGQTWTMTI